MIPYLNMSNIPTKDKNRKNVNLPIMNVLGLAETNSMKIAVILFVLALNLFIIRLRDIP